MRTPLKFLEDLQAGSSMRTYICSSVYTRMQSQWVLLCSCVQLCAGQPKEALQKEQETSEEEMPFVSRAAQYEMRGANKGKGRGKAKKAAQAEEEEQAEEKEKKRDAAEGEEDCGNGNDMKDDINDAVNAEEKEEEQQQACVTPRVETEIAKKRRSKKHEEQERDHHEAKKARRCEEEEEVELLPQEVEPLSSPPSKVQDKVNAKLLAAGGHGEDHNKQGDRKRNKKLGEDPHKKRKLEIREIASSYT